MKRIAYFTLLLTVLTACFSPKKEAEYKSTEPIKTESREGVELIITEERFNEPPVPTTALDDNAPRPVQNWRSKEMLSYRIGPGDIIRVTILVSLTANAYEVVVGTDGTAVVPLIGPFPVAGMYIEEAREKMRTALAEYYVDPQVQLRVTTFKSQSVYVMGLGGATLYYLEKRTTIFEILNSLGAALKGIDLDAGYLVRDNKIYPLHLSGLFEGDFSSNYEIVDNDVVYLPLLSESKIFLLGEVLRPGMYDMVQNENLFSLLARSGGPTIGAQLREIRIIRGGLENPILLTINMNNLMKRRPEKLLSAGDLTSLSISVEATRKSAMSLEKLYLQNGDIVFVPPTAIEKWNEILQQLAPSINFGFSKPVEISRDVIYLQSLIGGGAP